MWGYLSDKLGIPVSQLSRDNIHAELKGYGADDALCEKVIRVLDECEMARYTPDSSQEHLEKIYTEGIESINAMESVTKTKK